MPLDPSIILQGRAPQLDNPLDVQQKAQTLSNLGQQAKIQKQEIDVNQIKMAKQLAWSISDEPSYQAARQRGIELGLPNADKLPPNFDPNFVKSMQYNTLTAEDKFAREDRAADLQYREKQLENDKLNRQDAREERRYLHGVARRDKLDVREEKLAEKMQGLQTPYGHANTEDDAKKLKEAHELKKAFDGRLNEMVSLRKKHEGGAIMNRDDVRRGKTLANDLLLSYKELAKLGVMSQSDERILRSIIPEDPLQYNSPLAAIQGQDPILHGMEKFKGDSDSDFSTRISTRISTRTRGGQQKAAKSEDEQAVEWAQQNPNDPRSAAILKRNAGRVAGGG